MSQTLLKVHKALPPGIRRTLSRIQYEYLSHMDRDASMTLMNYGLANLDPESQGILLDDKDEPNRYSLQLYHYVATAVDLRGMDVLEVGCGRGGGASYVMRYLGPRSVVGVDITSRAIDFCQAHYPIAGLTFLRNRAESLPFDRESFDAVINIESSHCYASMDRFLENVKRVLKPGGYLLMADFRFETELSNLRRQVAKSGLTLVEEEDITPKVIRALDLDNERKEALIVKKVPRILQGTFREFAGMKGSQATYGKMKSGEMEYLRLMLQK